MASVKLTRTEVIVRIHGWNVVRAMRRTFRVPLGHVRDVRVRPEDGWFDDVIVEGWRGVGTYAPGKRAAGLVYLREGAAFYEVRDPTRTIALDLDHERVCRLVLQVDYEAPERAASRIVRAVERYYGQGSSDSVTTAPKAPASAGPAHIPVPSMAWRLK